MPSVLVNKSKLIVVALLVAVTLAAYWRAKDLSYSGYDDGGYITDNIHIQNGFSRDAVVWAFTTLHDANWHPLTWLSHTLDYTLYGPTPAGHHLTNLAIHVINVVLLFWLLQVMTGAVWRSGIVAALFAVHPLNVESVAWIAERKNVLSTFFFILCILAYVWYARDPGWRRYLIAVSLFALGLMCKPMLVTLPFVLLLLDYWPLDRYKPWRPESADPAKELASAEIQNGDPNSRNYPRRSVRLLLLEKAPLLLMAAASSVITFIAQARTGTVSSLAKCSIGLRLENSTLSYAKYLEKAVWPAGLAIIYPLPRRIPFWEFGVAAIVMLSVTGLVIWAGRRFKYLTVGWFWYLGTLVPVIGLIQLGGQARADRYTYIPLIGVFVMTTWGLAEAARRSRRTAVILGAVTICAVIALGLATSHQTSYWTDEITVFERARSVTDDSNVIAYINLGSYLRMKGKYDQAIIELSKFPKDEPGYDQVQYNIGMAYAQSGRLDEAVTHFKIALEVTPDYAAAKNSLGAALMDLGRIQEALPLFHEALELFPSFAAAYANLGSAHEQMGEFDQAMLYYARALQLTVDAANPDTIRDANEMGARIDCRMAELLARNGKTAEAVDRYLDALRLKPDYEQARQQLKSIQNSREIGKQTAR